VRGVATVVVVFCAPMLALVALAALFAGRAVLWEQVLVGVLNPVVGLAAAWAMLDDTFFIQRGRHVFLAAAVMLAANIGAAVSIAAGWSEGDTEIPLILAIPFATYVLYWLTDGSKAELRSGL